jgi:hypothetical protein
MLRESCQVRGYSSMRPWSTPGARVAFFLGQLQVRA